MVNSRNTITSAAGRLLLVPMSSSQSKNKRKSRTLSVLKCIKIAAKKVKVVLAAFLIGHEKPTSRSIASVTKPRNNNQGGGISILSYASTSNTRSSSQLKSFGSYGSSGTTSGLIETDSFSYEEILKATDNFSVSNKIGEGGFGLVYKGRLRNGIIVAIKRAKKDKYDRHSSQEFQNEILTLSKIEHLNLVRLYGYMEHGDERAIVIEYVGNGTLREHLDGTQGSGLEIAERLDIAIDVGHAITYLHTYSDNPMIHRDIKASNVLITEKLRAKVADFGFARLSGEDPGATHISTQVKGTAGYLDPEYLRTYQLTEKSDVYSFGVLLVELMTGRHPIEHKKPQRERVTIKWAIQRLKEGDAIIAMDPRLRRNPASTMAMEKVLKLAQQCLATSRQSRPSMQKCAEVLWKIRRDLRERPVPSHHSADFPVLDAKKNRYTLFGIEDGDGLEFISA
ncbi:calmodulin-binding receptor-like cytoplasmic kinase 1 [Tripterygium wilfordii]|uniref:non-specific serine/threonine protein kinase n=1 Tax=Tripterygium wilfordii TaxID=458696 RepID=A0A7J7DDV1_TRIWF|nr:calmodulin-binding receptor-like cytoplasmic kinase 1 [Tripterygium wilfordii]KAF5744537.1 calmodulin-binding receptor-like cytoplasmic kinase 1 [Tripterygium wilfordii]